MALSVKEPGSGSQQNLPSSLVRDNRKRGDPPDLRCPECPPMNLFLRSTRKYGLVSDQRRYTGERLESLPRTRYDRFQRGSRALAFQQCSFLASWCHLPFGEMRDVYAKSFQRFTHFVISLDSTILLSSLMISGPIHTAAKRRETESQARRGRDGIVAYSLS